MALMMPMTVITGFYGMNVALPYQHHPQVYLALLGVMLASVVAMLFVFKRWLANGQ